MDVQPRVCDGFSFKVHHSRDSVSLVETGREKGAMWWWWGEGWTAPSIYY